MRHRSIIGAGKAGSISRKQARSAALAAKSARPASIRGSSTSAAKAKSLPQTSSVWERFLGQFGAADSHHVMQSAPVSTQASAKQTTPVVKKTAVKKKGTKKVTSVA